MLYLRQESDFNIYLDRPTGHNQGTKGDKRSTRESRQLIPYPWNDSEGTALNSLIDRLRADVETLAQPGGRSVGTPGQYGVEGIPARWLDKLAMREEIEGLADGLLRVARGESVV
jgi:hypothetical protein